MWDQFTTVKCQTKFPLLQQVNLRHDDKNKKGKRRTTPTTVNRMKTFSQMLSN